MPPTATCSASPVNLSTDRTAVPDGMSALQQHDAKRPADKTVSVGNQEFHNCPPIF